MLCPDCQTPTSSLTAALPGWPAAMVPGPAAVAAPPQLFGGKFISTAAATCLPTSHDCCGLFLNVSES